MGRGTAVLQVVAYWADTDMDMAAHRAVAGRDMDTAAPHLVDRLVGAARYWAQREPLGEPAREAARYWARMN